MVVVCPGTLPVSLVFQKSRQGSAQLGTSVDGSPKGSVTESSSDGSESDGMLLESRVLSQNRIQRQDTEFKKAKRGCIKL